MAQKTTMASAGAIQAGKQIKIYALLIFNTTGVLSTVQIKEGGTSGTQLFTLKATGAAAGDSGNVDFGVQGLPVNDAWIAVGAGVPQITVVYDLLD